MEIVLTFSCLLYLLKGLSKLFTDADGSGGAAALRMNSAKIKMVVSFFISNLLMIAGYGYLPMPMEAAGAAALRMNSAKIKMVVSFFISNLLITQVMVIFQCRWKRRVQRRSG
jgi:membrane protein implicated in regulation of membrane protease activity